MVYFMDKWWLFYATLSNYNTNLGETFQKMLVTKYITFFLSESNHFCAENVVLLPFNFSFWTVKALLQFTDD